MKQSTILVFITVFFTQINYAAIINGSITSNNKPVESAKVILKGANKGATSNINGKFEILDISAGTYNLFVSCMGYEKDSLEITVGTDEIKTLHFQLKEINMDLNEIVVSGTLKERYLSDSPVAIDVITPKLFQKNPSPSIFESLSMVNGVRPQIQCNVCNTGDIHINGMEGPYTMVMIDGMPIVSALGTVYGLMGIPNSLIQRIEIQKGPASTLYGSEAVGGLINVITKSPINAPLFTFDFFGTSYQDFNADFSVKYKINKRLMGLFSGNGFYYDAKIDVNHDNFTDVTLQKRVAGFNKLTYEHKSGKTSHIAMRLFYEDRWGGEMNWTKSERGGKSVYGESIYTNRMEIIGSSPVGFLGKNVDFKYSFNNHVQNSAYGNTLFLADQKIAFGQLTKNIITDRNDIMIGIATRYTYYDDNTGVTKIIDADSSITNNPTITLLPGLFVQDELQINENNTLLLGMRYDYNSLHGNILSPRINWKYSIDEFNTIRWGLGNGYRVVNLFSEDHAAFNGARDIVVMESLKPEQSWNTNFNYSTFKALKKGFLTLDANLFYTYFSNKIVADYFTDHTKVIFDNLDGYGINRGGGVQMHFSFDFPLKISLGFTYTDLYIIEKNNTGIEQKKRQVQTPPLTSNFVVSYSIDKIKTKLDLSGNITSTMLLPVLPNDFRPDHSPWFCIMNIQATTEIKKKWQVYYGVKNLLNFIPQNPIMRPNDPFDLYTNDPINNPKGYTFDPSYNYAPIQKIRVFAGVRYVFK